MLKSTRTLPSLVTFLIEAVSGASNLYLSRRERVEGSNVLSTGRLGASSSILGSGKGPSKMSVGSLGVSSVSYTVMFEISSLNVNSAVLFEMLSERLIV